MFERHGYLMGLGLIVIIGLVLRLYQFSTPLADWHSFRQADTASVAREFLKQGLNLLEPKYHDLSNIQSGKENPQGFRMVELPVISALVMLLQPVIPGLELHQVYRLVNILFSLGIIVLLYTLTAMLDDRKVGLIAASGFAFLPFAVYYSRTTLPEIPLVFLVLLSMFSFMRYINQQRVWWLVGFGVTFSLALLLKPTAIFFIPPLIAYALLKLPLHLRIVVPWMLTMFFSVMPLLLWRVWILNFPEGIPASDWLLNGNNIRLKPAFFRWLFAERLAKLILGYYGIVLLVMGYMYAVKGLSRRLTPADYLKRITVIVRRLGHAETLTHASMTQVFYFVWTLGMLLYLIVIASGNVQHDYYQIILLPLICIMVARGIMFFLDQHTLTGVALMLICVVSMIGFSWYEVKGYFNINNWAMVRAGQAVDRLTPEDALVIAPYMGDTAFLYQTNRRGWPIGFDIEDKISKGASYYVSTSLDDEARELSARYQVVEQTDEYILIHLIK